MTYVQERIPSANIALPDAAPQYRAQQAALGTSRAAMLGRGDGIRRTGPQFLLPPNNVTPAPGGGLFNAPWGSQASMGGIVSQLLNVIQQLVSMLSLTGLFGNVFGGSPQTPQIFFQSANGSSTGDPHLGFDGTDASGAHQQSHFDSMTGHGDLLDSDSFAGGYQLSTSVTQPEANGVTYNRQATVCTGFGATQVSLDKDGNATIVQNGQTACLANGQSIDLGDGETVTRNSDGSLIVRDDNGMGGTITTTLRENGRGVDVNTQADNVDLGGDLVNQQTHLQPMHQPVGQPIRAPQPLLFA